jgi:hypothetical protein
MDKIFKKKGPCHQMQSFLSGQILDARRQQSSFSCVTAGLLDIICYKTIIWIEARCTVLFK